MDFLFSVLASGPEEALVKLFFIPKPIRSLVILLLALLISLTLAANYPLTVTDELGREITLTSEPQRIVSMVPSHTETLCALNACEKLVAVDSFSNYPEEVLALPNVGGNFGDANIEVIVALEPDLVLVSEYGNLAETLANLGLTVYAGSPQSYEDVFAQFDLFGRLLHRQTEAAVLTGRIRGEIETLAALAQELPPPKVFYELDATPYSVGPNSFIGVLIAKAGGENIVTENMGDFPQLDPEFIVAANPELIFLADAPYGETAASVKARPGWANIRAVQTGKIIELSQEQVDVLNRPGPRMAEAVRLLLKSLHPQLF